MTAGSILVLALLLSGTALAGTALLARLLGPGEEEADASLALGPLAGLLVFALPGWILFRDARSGSKAA